MSIPTSSSSPIPVVNSDLKSRNWFTDPNAMRVMLAEYAKVLLAGARNMTGFGRHHRPALGKYVTGQD